VNTLPNVMAYYSLVGYEVLSTLVMKRYVFWDVCHITSVSENHVASVIRVDK
jgi:hypothetical protein